MEKDRVILDVGKRVTLERLVSAGKGASRKLTHARFCFWPMLCTATTFATRTSSQRDERAGTNWTAHPARTKAAP